MLKLAASIPAYISFRTLGRPRKMPFNITIGVSYHCNSRCMTCNIWKKGKTNELKLEEYEKIFKKMGRSVFWATLSGGEPFLRSDLAEIARSLYNNCRPAVITIPTNGVLGELIAQRIEAIAAACPKSEIVVNLSLDGKEEEHDRIRGVPGNFKKVMEAYSALRKIVSPNVTLGIHTVISRFNVKKIPRICDFVLDELKPDSYISEVAEERTELDTKGSAITPDADDYAEAVDYIKKRTAGLKAGGIAAITRAFRMNYYEFAKKVLKESKQPIPCYAGFASAQISPEGDVWGCCVRAEPLGNLRENDYDFKKIWLSPRADEFRQSVKQGKCACPLANAFYSSALCNPNSMIKVLAKL